jgi:hypothetical protein
MNVLYLIKKFKIFFSQALLRRSRLKFALKNTNTIAKLYRNHTHAQWASGPVGLLGGRGAYPEFAKDVNFFILGFCLRDSCN